MKKRQIKRFTQKAFAVMFKHIEGWTVSGVEFHFDTALKEMEHQREQLSSFKYKVVPCQIWVTLHNLKSPPMPKPTDQPEDE